MMIVIIIPSSSKTVAAGPALARMFTERVSALANLIHRDVGGDRHVRLEWSSTFELELADTRSGKGRRRPIEVLSGE